MKFDLPETDPRHLRESAAKPAAASEPLVPPGPIERRIDRLREVAANPLQVHLPARKQAPKPSLPIEREAQPRRPRRDREPAQAIGVHLRPEERQVLLEVGRFRVIAVRDLGEALYGGDGRALASYLRYLKERGLVSLDIVNARRDGQGRSGEPIEVVTLTREGLRLAQAATERHPEQRLYAGLVKPREVEHDAAIFRACRKEWERIEREGGSHRRVKLDFELKSQAQRALYAEHKAAPERNLKEIRAEIAQRLDLPMVNDRIEFPDARLEYDLDGGSRVGSVDVEVATSAYRPGHMRGKVQAGFRMYLSGRDRGRLGGAILDDSELMERVLDL